jgi:polyisoprenoid-binding protein YceI
MTAPKNQTRRPRFSRRTRNLLLLGIAAIFAIGVIGGGYGLWYLFLRGPGAPSVDSAPPLLPSGAPVAVPASFDGTWQVNDTLGSMDDFSASWAGYRVQEALVGIGGHVAVGRSPKVTGSMTLQGAVVKNVSIAVDMTALVSDDPSRDDQLRHQAIATDQFPTSKFELTSPLDLGSLPADGTTVKATATGNLTLHGTTKPVTIALQAVRKGGIIAVTGSMQVTFSDFGFQGPSSAVVLSVKSFGIMEFHLLFTHA